MLNTAFFYHGNETVKQSLSLDNSCCIDWIISYSISYNSSYNRSFVWCSISHFVPPLVVSSWLPIVNTLTMQHGPLCILGCCSFYLQFTNLRVTCLYSTSCTKLTFCGSGLAGSSSKTGFLKGCYINFLKEWINYNIRSQRCNEC